MATTDQQVLTQVQSYLIETENGGASWSSGFWTVQEVIDYLNERQRKFIIQTGLLAKVGTVPLAANVLRIGLPSDLVELRFVAFNAQSGIFWDLPRADPLQADLYSPNWTFAAKPIPDAYSTTETPNLELELHPASSLGGVLEVMYLWIAAVLGNGGAPLTVPDDFAPVIVWGVLADMLKKTGRALSSQRAEYAENRYTMGVELAKLILNGWA
jgi:hypothetical protein